MENIVYLMDCMEFLKTCPDKAFDLAIVDPPYGDGNQDVGGGTVRTTVREVQPSTSSTTSPNREQGRSRGNGRNCRVFGRPLC